MYVALKCTFVRRPSKLMARGTKPGAKGDAAYIGMMQQKQEPEQFPSPYDLRTNDPPELGPPTLPTQGCEPETLPQLSNALKPRLHAEARSEQDPTDEPNVNRFSLRALRCTFFGENATVACACHAYHPMGPGAGCAMCAYLQLPIDQLTFTDSVARSTRILQAQCQSRSSYGPWLPLLRADSQNGREKAI
ncbi:adhesin [Anopheles sinensis]|uniref:Adhesin n=1 Tax=Anopheles sinensis TaxID=74873 RepID=A0A084VEI0_ANOSI|nr:adhesin [Anopheles sinensis]